MNSNHVEDICWVPASSGAFPSNAVVAGVGDDDFYIARAYHQGALIPGRLIPSQGACYVSWGGAEHRKDEYEVLCGDRGGGGGFVRAYGENIPPNAVPAGWSETNEPLYIGRVWYKEPFKQIRTIGKVQRSHAVCYFAYDGREVSLKGYEIYVTLDQRPNIVPDSQIVENLRSASSIYWVQASSGAHPSNAIVVAGKNGGEDCYFARAYHQGALIPGSLVPSRGICFVSWCGTEHGKSKYEVLCGRNGEFVSASGRSIPSNAIRAGKSKINEPLFIGRVWHNGTWIAGTVQRSHGSCIVLCDGKEKSFAEYEIYVMVKNCSDNGDHYHDDQRSNVFSDGKLAENLDEGDFCWIRASNGEYPSKAVVGGKMDGEDLYIARAYHQRSLTPGKLVPLRGLCYVSWGGGVHGKSEYEVLCGGNGMFVPTHGTSIPPNAIRAGRSETKEPLYIGRVLHNGSKMLGKIQQSHGVCYIPCGEKEIPYAEYEIYVTNDQRLNADRIAEDTCWIPASDGRYPSNAVVAGMDGEVLFVARAYHQGALTPGKLVPSHGVCYISWGGSEYGKSEYEVLCHESGVFVPTSGTNIPPNAVKAGVSENGEPLYVGRVSYKGIQTPGKVQESFGACFIPYNGMEIAFNAYEIYVTKEQPSSIYSDGHHTKNLHAGNDKLKGRTLVM